MNTNIVKVFTGVLVVAATIIFIPPPPTRLDVNVKPFVVPADAPAKITKAAEKHPVVIEVPKAANLPEKVIYDEESQLIKVAEVIRKYREEPGSQGVILDTKTSTKYAKAFMSACEEFNVDLSTAIGMAWYESGFKYNEVSSSGAVGIMQIMPRTAKGYKVTRAELFNPEINIRTGIRHLSVLKYSSGCSWATAIRGYNQGLNRALKNENRGGNYLRVVRKHSGTVRNRIKN